MSGQIKLANLHLAWEAIIKIKNWKDYFYDLLNLTNQKYIIYKIRDGLSYIVRAKTTDRGIVTTVVLDDEYRIDNLILPKDAIIIDIGAQIGIFSVYSSRKAEKVFLYEPVLQNYKLVLKNIKINKLGNKLTPFNLAVSDKKEKIKIFLCRDNTGGHSIYGDSKNYVEVQTTTLAEIFEKNKIKKCDLLKLDVEGSEYKIFYTLPPEYFSKILRIRMECHDIDNSINNHQHLIRFLKSKGYKIIYNHPILFADKIS